MKMRDAVRAGSWRTRSPVLVTKTVRRLVVACSATMGEMLDLNAPVPRPTAKECGQLALLESESRPSPSVRSRDVLMMMARAKTPTADWGWMITEGMAAMTRRTWPTRAIATATQTVL